MNANLDLPITKGQRRSEHIPVRRYLLNLLRGIVLLIVMPVFGVALLIGIAQMEILA
jgi:hypothetical protein